jgi:FkbM family methyltransferase
MEERIPLMECARRLKILAKDRAHYDNAWEIARALFGRRPPASVRLRQAFEIRAPFNVSAVRLVREIVVNRVYSRPPFGIEPDDTVVDIGANIGVFTLHAASATRGRVCAVEALPENAEFIRTNAALNRFENIEVVSAAVCGKSGTVEFSVSPNGAMGAVSQPGPATAGDRRITVPAVTLPELLERWGLREVDFLKLDCEGSEGDIFRSLPEETLRRIRKIALEFHDCDSSLSHAEIEERLRRAGFVTELDWDGRASGGIIRARRLD